MIRTKSTVQIGGEGVFTPNGITVGLRGNAITRLIKRLFANNEQGFFYDPSDLKTQYQDASGTTAVTATWQPLGLLLDKSKPVLRWQNILENFLTEDGWVKSNPDISISVVGDSLRISKDAITPQSTYKVFSCEANKLYRLSVKYKNHTGDNVRFFIRNINGTGLSPTLMQSIQTFLATDGSGDSFFITTADTHSIVIDSQNAAESSVDIESISVVKVSDSINHAYQTTSAARPLFKQKPILGSELLDNNSFDTALGWVTTGGWVVANGVAYRPTNTVLGALRQNPVVTAGKYLLTVKYSKATGHNYVALRSPAGDSYPVITNAGASNASGMVSVEVNLAGSLAFFDVTSSSNATIEIEEVSFKRIAGYRTDRNYIEYDKVDAKLITNLSAPLTNVTVLRAIPNVGTQVKYNQTLPRLYEDSTNHSGLVAINRALTRTEQLRLMEEFDKKAGAVGFDTTIFKTFDNNQEGFVFDPNDLSTMFQDATGTVPVTGVGQPVGLIKDKSGRNNHARQTTSASRPILRQNAITGANYLEFDGSDDFLRTANIDFTATDKVSVFAGVLKVSDGFKIITELSASINSNAGSFQLVTVSTPENGYSSISRGTSSTASINRAISFTYPAPDAAVLSAKHDISTDLSSISRNGVVGTYGSGDQGSGNFGNYPLYIGRRGGVSLPFNGHIYGLIGIGKLTTYTETAAIEKELAKRTGVTLNV